MFGLRSSYCSKRNCPNIKCDRNMQKIPWGKLPDWAIVTVRDFAGTFDCCPENTEVQEGDH